MKFRITFILMLCCLSAFAQQQAPQTPEEREKTLLEGIDKQIEHLTETLDLSDWQIFYVDSVMVHDYKAMDKELMDLSAAKVTNSDLYIRVQDEWTEKMYNAFHGILDEEQWTKYLKQGAARAKKARDKRIAKWSK